MGEKKCVASPFLWLTPFEWASPVSEFQWLRRLTSLRAAPFSLRCFWAKARFYGEIILQLQTRKNNLIFVAYFQDEIYGTEK